MMDIQDLIKQGEGEQLEFKSTLQWDVKQGKKNENLRFSVLKTIAAFLNTHGGTLLIGVEDSGEIHGLEDDLALVGNSRDKFEQLLADLIAQHLGNQYIPLVDGHFESIDDKLIYVYKVQPSSKPVYFQKRGDNRKIFYIRSHTTTRDLDPKETFEYIRNHWQTGKASSPSTTVAEGRYVMKPFHTIAIPHDDILEGRLTMDVFAADLWEVYQGRGPEEYRDPELFFRKTYETNGLRNLYAVVEKRLKGQGGDPVIQLQTPFGGGKTHSLIALYHKARDWGVKTTVISGTTLPGDETLWGLLAEQLTGTRRGYDGMTSPGREAIRNLLEDHQPILILMDEVLQYATKAAGVMVGESNLAAQTMAFLQELTEAASMMEKVVVVVTLPSSIVEHYDEHAEIIFSRLTKISGRVEKVFTPVQDDEVGSIIRRRLFSKVDEKAANRVINAFVEQAEQESLLQRGEESEDYRARFRQTYPFLPDVVDVLYHRWGSFPTFQRTRGTLRLLALVVDALKRSNISYISLADFDLANDDIRRELLKHLGNEYDSVLASDIIGKDAGAHRVNSEIGKSYQGLGLGERIATTIFMYSHIGGGGEAGATLNEIKRQNMMNDVPTSLVAEIVQKLNDRWLFYLHESGRRYYFSTTANLNRALTIRKENTSTEELRAAENEVLRKQLGGRKLKTYLWPENTGDIPDDEMPKLLVMKEDDTSRMKEFVERKGQTPRVHRNTLCFLAPQPTERRNFDNLLRDYLAVTALLDDKTISLSQGQRTELKRRAEQTARDLREQIGNLYRLLYLPSADGFQNFDMGISIYGGNQLDTLVFDRLRDEGRLVEKIAPLLIKEKYLTKNDYLETRKLVESGSRTPGELLVLNRSVWESSIAEGVQEGLFGLGELDENGKPRCVYFKKAPTVSLQGNEVIIRAEICEEPSNGDGETPGPTGDGTGRGVTRTPPGPTPPEPGRTQKMRQFMTLRFRLPFGQVSSLLGLLNLLQQRFRTITFTIQFADGSISEDEIEDKVRETFRQIGTDVEIE